MGRVKTFVAGGTYAAVDFNGIQDDYEFLHSAYKRHVTQHGAYQSGFSGTTIMLGHASRWANGNAPGAAAPDVGFYLDPTDWPTGAGGYSTRALKLRLKGNAVIGGTAPACDFTVGIAPVASYVMSGNPSIAGPATLGTTIGSVTLTAPAANTQPAIDTGDLTFPAAPGWYAVFVQATSASVPGVPYFSVDVLVRAA